MPPDKTFVEASIEAVRAAAAAVEKSPELAAAQRDLDRLREEKKTLMIKGGELWDAYQKSRLSDLKIERKYQAVHQRLRAIDDEIREVRLRRADFAPDYYAALATAMAVPAAEAMRSVLAAVAVIDANLAVVREMASILSPAYTADLVASPAMRIAFIDARPLDEIEAFAKEFLKPSVSPSKG